MILVDTHVVAWLAFEPDRLSPKARSAVQVARQDGHGLAVSDITLWELTILVNKGRLHSDISLESLLSEVEARFAIVPITRRACVLAVGLPADFPRDPADRIIAATALAQGLPLLTADREIRRSNAVPTIW